MINKEKREPQLVDDLISLVKLFSYKFHANEPEKDNLLGIKADELEKIAEYWRQFLKCYSCCANIESITSSEQIEMLIESHFKIKFSQN